MPLAGPAGPTTAKCTPAPTATPTDAPGPDLAAALARTEPRGVGDEELIDRIGAWEKIKAWAEAGQLAEIAELTPRRRATDERERADHTAPRRPR